MDGFSRLQQQQQHGGGTFWYPSSSSPPPPAGYHPPPPPYLAQNLPLPPPHTAYHHQASYASQFPITPPSQHQLPQPWFHPPQQPAPPAMSAPPSSAPLPHYHPPYHGQPGLPPPYPQPQHRYPPPQPHPMAPPSPAYPPSIQAWGNPSWQHHPIWEYPDRNIHYSSEEDWAAKARAWAAADSMTENHHARSQFTSLGRMDEHEYTYHDHLPKVVAPAVDNQLPLLPQSNGRSLYNEDETTARETGHLTSPPRSYYPSSSIDEQEVPYTYSSSQGNRDAMDLRERSQESLHSQFTAPVQLPSVEEPHFIPGNWPAKPSSDISDQPLDFQRKSTFVPDQHKQFSYSHVGSAANDGMIDQNIVAASVHNWSSTSAPVVAFPPIPLAPSGTQFESSVASQPSLTVHSAPVFVGIAAPNFQAPVSPISTPFGLGIGTSLHATDFPGDGSGSFNPSDRPKKAAVPNWLREEIIKKKSAIASTNFLHSGGVEREDADMSFRRTDQADIKSLDSRSTVDEDDDEDEVEAARSAAINQDIKRVLTEVLLKVTDELFDEIATKVLGEDEPTADVVESASIGNPKLSPPPSIPTPKASSKILVPARADSKNDSKIFDDASEKSSPNSAGGDLLGLANYDSDASDGDEDDESQRALSKKLDSASHHLETAARSYEHAMKDVETGKGQPSVDANGDVQKERKISLPDSSGRKRVGQFHAKVPKGSEASEKISSINSERAGEFQQDDAKCHKSSGTAGNEGGRRHESVNGDRTTSEECQDGEANILSSAGRKPERNLNNRGLIKEVAAGSHRSDNENNELGDKQKDKIDKRDKLYDRFGDRNVKQGAIVRETHSKSSSKSDSIKDSRKEILKDKGEKKKDYERRSERKRDRKEDYKRSGKEEDRPQFARETLRHNFRSKSPVSIGIYRKDNSTNFHDSASSEESSDNSRKRKLQSRGIGLSASPQRSTKRQASRSPHSKHSHCRHSPYSTARRNRRSRSISPVHRRRPSKHE